LRNVAIFGAPPEFVALRRGIPALRPAPNSVLDRVVTTKQPQHILDFRDEQTYLNRLPNSVQLAEIAGVRTVLGVPLIRANEVIGAITIYRRHVESFTNTGHEQKRQMIRADATRSPRRHVPAVRAGQ
jgi:transcriptional regulator with GAF, ATPase, and Fis domain